MSSGNAVVGVPSGFYDLDNLTSGFKASDLIVVAGRPAMGKCLTANTLIDDPRTGARLTIREFVRRRLPLVWGISSEGLVRPTRVGDWVDSGVQDAFRVRTWTGRTVEVTGHHPFLTTDGWQPLYDLGVGDSIAVPRQVPCFGSDDRAGPDRIQALVRHLSERRRTARLPAECWRWSRARLLELVGTLFGESGSQLTVASEGLAGDLQHALTRFGIVSTIWGSRAGRWTVRITDRGMVVAPALSSLATVGSRQEGLLASREIRMAAYAYLIDEAQGLRLSSPDLYWDEIVSVEPVGRQQVYDLTVPDGANFIAQDVLVHNTSFMLNLTLHAAVERQVPVAVFSLEMSKEQLVERLLCQQARIDSQRMHRGMLSEAEYERLVMAIGPLENAPIFIDDSPVLDELSLLLKARQARLRENIGMVVLDYLQLMQGRGGRGDDFNRVQEVSSISRSLKALARELKLPVIAISQLSRAPEARPNKRPMLSDLRECVVGSTRLVHADNGRWVPIRDVARGDRILAMSPNRRFGAYVVADVWSTGRKPVFTLSTVAGLSIVATANHPVFTKTGWRRLADLRKGDRVAAGSPALSMSSEPAGLTMAQLAPHKRSLVRGWTPGEQQPDLYRGTDAELVWDAISGIEPAGIEEVFDISVPGANNFLGNGIVAHNSGSIEQDSDIVMFLYRDEYYNPSTDQQGIAEVHVAKHRNGPTDTIKLRFRKDQTLFYNLESRRPEPEPV
jgi:replicative DNA helicase